VTQALQSEYQRRRKNR